MAITRGATISTYIISAATTAVSYSHTVDANTSLLILTITLMAPISLTVEPYWNTTEAFTLIHATTNSGLSGDVHNYIYGLINPSAGAHNITFTVQSTDNISSTSVNYIGTVNTSVEDAMAYLNEKVNDTATTTTVLASGGQSGNTLFACANFYGGDGDPSTNATGFEELADSATGTSTTLDQSFYVADLIGGAPAAITVDWYSTGSDENAGQLIEIIPASEPVTQPRIFRSVWPSDAGILNPAMDAHADNDSRMY